MDAAAIVLVIVLAMAFNYTNGFHDAANSIATSVSTRALTPRVAVALAAVANFAGAFLGQRVAETVGSGIIAAPSGATGLAIAAAALVGAIGWNMLTWWFGLPSSSSHALIGGLGGAALAAGAAVQWHGVLDLVLIPMLVSPVVGLVGGYLLMMAILWTFRRGDPVRVRRHFRYAQTLSAAAVALGHGMQDAAKTAGVVILSLTVAGRYDSSTGVIPWWVFGLSAFVISLGTYAGGWRIMHTLGRRIAPLDSPQGFAAETTAAVILFVATAFRAPISTTHAIASAITGAGATRGVRAVRWKVARTIAGAWVFTLPGAGVAAVGAYGVIAAFR